MNTFLCCLLLAVAVAQALPSQKRSFYRELFNDDNTASDVEYNGCKDQSLCAKKTITDCETNKIVNQICPRLCGNCAPFPPTICPKKYKYGCCPNGEQSFNIKKTDCPACQDRAIICSLPFWKESCEGESNTVKARELCPVTCNACTAYGNDCADREPDCQAKLDSNEWSCASEETQKDCKKSCDLCPEIEVIHKSWN